MKYREVRKMMNKIKVLSFALISAASLTACSFNVDDVIGSLKGAGEDVVTVINVAEDTKAAVEKAAEILEGTDWETIENEDTKDKLSDEINGSIGGFQKVNIIRVVDGDTIVVDIYGDNCNSKEHKAKVRLIGVDTPESVASEKYLKKTGKKNTAEGKGASEFTKDILKDVEYVYLDSDKGDTDKYGRLLRYVWLEIPDDKYDLEEVSTKMLNGLLLDEKIAVPMPIKPNVAYEDEFEEIYERD